MDRSENIGTLAAALVKVQAALKPVKRESRNEFFKANYADLSTIMEEARPLLAANGLAVMQFAGETKVLGTEHETDKDGVVTDLLVGSIGLTTILAHESGEWIGETMEIPYALEGPQKAMAALTYARRGAFAAAVGVVSEEDDDGNTASERRGRSTKTEQTKPSGPEDCCPVHTDTTWRHNEGIYKKGHAKEGQSYSFWGCPVKLADGSYCKETPPAGYAKVKATEGTSDPDAVKTLLQNIETALPKKADRMTWIRSWCAANGVAQPASDAAIPTLGTDVLARIVDALKPETPDTPAEAAADASAGAETPQTGNGEVDDAIESTIKSLETLIPLPAKRLTFARNWCAANNIALPGTLPKLPSLGLDVLLAITDEARKVTA